VRAEPLYIRSVISADGNTEESAAPTTRLVLDPRVAFLVTSLMEGVINHGTGYPVRALGFTAPAAGKTGTSRDGWFAGYTSNLLCVVWVGFDDNRNLGLAGGQTAAPIWGEFMKRAVALPRYRNTQEFAPPAGIQEATIDPQSGQLATPSCPKTETEYFVTGSEPTQYCELHGGTSAQSGGGSWLSHLFGKGGDSAQPPPAPTPAPSVSNSPHSRPATPSKPQQAPTTQTAQQPEKKKGILDRIFGIFGGSKQPADNSKPQQ
jgi:penicillin-binding protein 1B